ncbi:MAG: zinc ABC transporter ATP-binding protein ZnuC [Pseudomonadales bacterium]|nr:zinc ABC transporter ATP-binding protein ZnuC [Pseudomonadales bacterium]
MPSDSLIKLEGVSVYRRKQLIQNIQLTINPGEIITVIGPNGAGKSTLVRVAVGLVKPTEGKRIVKPGLRIGYMPQQIHIEPTFPLTVYRFLQLAHRAAPKSTQASKQNQRSKLKEQLSEVGAAHVIDTPLQNLSGGELQRVMLARALLRQPELLVLDEPVQGVDIAGQQALYQLISQIRGRYGCGILMVSHDLHLVMAATDHVVCLNQHICCSGHPEAVTNDPAYLELFGSNENLNLALYTHNHDHHHHLDGHVISEGKQDIDRPAEPNATRETSDKGGQDK